MGNKLSSEMNNYQPSQAAIKLVKDTPILLLVGPTGAGKDSLKDRLLATKGYHHIVSHTTRSPRINHGILEVEGVDYHFIDKPEAQSMIEHKEFVEVKTYSGNIYGTSVAEILRAKRDSKVALTDLEVQGVAEYKAIDPNVMSVFLLPPDFKTWQERLSRRYGDVVDAKDHMHRLSTALNEIHQLLNTNFYTAVVNKDLNETRALVESIVKHRNKNIDDSVAREVAKQLAKDINKYLEKQSQ